MDPHPSHAQLPPRTGPYYPPAAEIEISAPIQMVWECLLDGAAYPQWNTFIRQVDGDFRTLTIPIKMKVDLGGWQTTPRLRTVRLAPPTDRQGSSARWIHHYADWPARFGLIRSERHHILHPLGDGRTTYYATYETFSGVFGRAVPFQRIDAGFKRQARDLKAWCERPSSQP